MTYSMTITEYLSLGDTLCWVTSADGGVTLQGFLVTKGHVNILVQCIITLVTKEAIIYYIFLLFTQLLIW